jgi:hypothetical protein
VIDTAIINCAGKISGASYCLSNTLGLHHTIISRLYNDETNDKYNYFIQFLYWYKYINFGGERLDVSDILHMHSSDWVQYDTSRFRNCFAIEYHFRYNLKPLRNVIIWRRSNFEIGTIQQALIGIQEMSDSELGSILMNVLVLSGKYDFYIPKSLPKYSIRFHLTCKYNSYRVK